METARRYAPYAVLAILVALACAYGVAPQGRNDSHAGRMWLAGFSVLIVIAWAASSSLVADAAEKARLALRGLMTVGVVVGAFNYYQFDPAVFTGLGDSTDITYYYVNSKYLKELGYFKLYPAMILADKETSDHHSSQIRQYRDLRDYEVKPVKFAYEHGEEIKRESFTPERWEAFKHDIDWFLHPSRKSTRSMQSNFYVDHGYNPPPTWSVVGGALANVTAVEDVKRIAYVDVGLVAVMFAGVAWAFGFDAALFSALFFLCTFSGRWPILGEALLRFDWLTALVLSVCCAKKEKWALSGAFLSYAAFNRIFPAIFFFGWGITAALDTWRTRTIAPRDLRFAGGAALVAAVLVAWAAIAYGPRIFVDSKTNLLMHNRSYSSHRVGLGDLILFRGEKTREEMALTTYEHPDGRVTKGIAAKELKIQDMQPLLRLTAVGALLFLSVYASRVRREQGGREPWELWALAILPFFCATNPQINYYNLRMVLYVWHGFGATMATRDRGFHLTALGVLFAGEAATQSAFLTEVDGHQAERYYVTCTTSVWMGIYFALLCGWLVWDGWFTDRDGDAPASPAPAEAAAV